jgi:DNA-binding CsgD family transcriptional regulator
MNRHPDELSDDGKLCLEMMAQGKTHREIAAALSVSVRTAKRRTSGIREMLGVKTQKEAVAEATKRGLRPGS